MVASESATGGSSGPALLDKGASTGITSEGCFAAFKGGKAVSKKQDRMKDARACEKGSESGGRRDCAAPAAGETPTALSSDFAGTKARTDAARWSEGGCGPPKQKKKDPREEPPCPQCGVLEGHAGEPHWPQTEVLDRDFARKIGGLRREIVTCSIRSPSI